MNITDLTDEQKIEAIRKACGWGDASRNPLEDLNAMYAAEEHLTEDQGGDFEEHLEAICQRDLEEAGTNHWLRFKVAHATARQRADAFLLTIDA